METAPSPGENETGNELSTLADYVRWAASRFGRAKLHFGHGTDNAVDEALQLVAHGLDLSLPLPPEFFFARLTAPEKASLEWLIERRIRARRPAAYLTGQALLVSEFAPNPAPAPRPSPMPAIIVSCSTLKGSMRKMISNSGLTAAAAFRQSRSRLTALSPAAFAIFS